MIKDLIVRLMEEANEEADRPPWELHTVPAAHHTRSMGERDRTSRPLRKFPEWLLVERLTRHDKKQLTYTLSCHYLGPMLRRLVKDITFGLTLSLLAEDVAFGLTIRHQAVCGGHYLWICLLLVLCYDHNRLWCVKPHGSGYFPCCGFCVTIC